MRDCDVGEVRIDDLYNLVVVISQLLKLEIKVIQTGNKLHFRRVAFDDNELLGEDAFDDKPAAVMFQSCLTKHLLKADILFRGEFEIIPVDPGVCCCRASDPLFRGCHQSGSLSGVTRERHPASQSEHLSYAEKLFGIQRYSSLLSGDNKNPRRRIFERSFENPPLRLPGSGLFPVQYYNRFGAKKIHRCGLERTGADIGAGLENEDVYCGRKNYSDKQTDD
jgi:hypothetical protein